MVLYCATEFEAVRVIDQKNLNKTSPYKNMEKRKYFAYFMILAGLILEFFTFKLCTRTLCYFFNKCNGELSVECLAAFFVASLLLVIGGLCVLKKSREEKYV